MAVLLQCFLPADDDVTGRIKTDGLTDQLPCTAKIKSNTVRQLHHAEHRARKERGSIETINNSEIIPTIG